MTKSGDFGWLAYLATVASIVLKEGLARYAFYIARKTGNAAVKADGWHHRSDALSSLMVLAGLFPDFVIAYPKILRQRV